MKIQSVYKNSDESLHKKMKCSIKDFFSKCDQLRRKLRILSQTAEILMGNFIVCAWHKISDTINHAKFQAYDFRKNSLTLVLS